MIRRCLTIVFLAFLAGIAPRAFAETVGGVHVVIVAGDPGNEMYARHYRDRVSRFHAYFANTMKVPVGNIIVLSGDAAQKDPVPAGKASADTLVKNIRTSAGKTAAADQFVLVLLGHGQAGENSPLLQLPGRDVEIGEIAAAIKDAPAGTQVILNFVSNAGESIPVLRHPNRVVITATGSEQNNATDYAEFFLQAIEKPGANLLDVYNVSTLRLAEWTVRQKRSADPESKGWIVEGKQSADIFRKLYSGKDVPEDRQFVVSGASERPDGPVVIMGNEDKAYWTNRRMMTETPMLQEANQEKGATCLTEKGYKAIAPAKAGDAGSLARQITLGNPSRIAATNTREANR